MKALSLALLIAAIGMVGAGLAHADAAWIGPTGMILTPTAEVAEEGTVDLQAHLVNRATDLGLYGGTFGLGTGLEVATSIVDPNGPGNNTLLHFKYSHRFAAGQLIEPISLAVGINDVSNEMADRCYYVVVTKDIRLPAEVRSVRSATVSVGLANSENNKSLDGLFASAEVGLPHSLSAILEFDTDNFNFGLRYRVGGLGLDAAVLDSDFGYGAVFSTDF